MSWASRERKGHQGPPLSFIVGVAVASVCSSIVAYHWASTPIIDSEGKLANCQYTPNPKGEYGPVGVAFNPDHHHVYGTYPMSGKVSAHLVGNSHVSLHNDVTRVSDHCARPRALVHDRSRYHFYFTCADEHHHDTVFSRPGHAHDGDAAHDPDNDGIYEIRLPSMEVSTAVPRGVLRHPAQLAMDRATGDVIVAELSKTRGVSEWASETLAPSGTGRIVSVAPEQAAKHVGKDAVDAEYHDGWGAEHGFRVIVDGVNAPMGVEVSHDGESVLVASAADWTIRKYPLRGTSATRAEDGEIVTHLPGVPSAIKIRTPGESDGGRRRSYWVAVHSIPDWYWPGYWIPNLGPLRSIFAALIPEKWLRFALGGASVILEIDERGEVLTAHQDPDGHVSHVSDIVDSEVWLHIASAEGPGIFHHKIVDGHRSYRHGHGAQMGTHVHE